MTSASAPGTRKLVGTGAATLSIREGVPMGMLKRKRTSPPDSPAPSKKPVQEESPAPLRSSDGNINNTNEDLEVTTSPSGKSQVEETRTVPEDPRVTKQELEKDESMPSAALAAEEAVVRSGPETDGDDIKTIASVSVENVSHGQRNSFQASGPPCNSLGPSAAPPKKVSGSSSPEIGHRIPTHAGWFQWTRIHRLERLGLPEYFSGKNPQKTPETYIEYRNRIITKYRENPQKLMKLEDMQGLLTGDNSEFIRLFGFLDHWGLINYQATADFTPFCSAEASMGSVEETPNGALQIIHPPKIALINLFEFESALAPAPKLLLAPTGPPGSSPLSSLAEAVVQESLSAPAVEYHCNSCQADCSKRRYHCQKQADFDLCPDCYGDGKFGNGMTGTDFLRMDALTDKGDASGGGWSDQETLLLLEGLELYGENWNEIAEHVATKSKPQCILHFIRLPIEDSFLEDLETSNFGITAQPPDTPAVNSDIPAHESDKQIEPESQKLEPASLEKQETSSNSEHGTDLEVQKDTPSIPDETQSIEKDAPALKTETQEKEISEPVESKEPKELSVAQGLLAAGESAEGGGPDGLIAFADAGNPVMAQVAFLAAMVGPRIAAAAAQAALKSLTEEDPVGFLSAKNSFALEFPDKDGILVPGSSKRLTEQPPTPIQSATEVSENKTHVTGMEESKNKNPSAGVAVSKGAAEEGSCKPEGDIPISTASVVEEEKPTLEKVHSAASSALASAAVKAKLLADQEEREIQRLVTTVIENQLKKLELKLKHFNELEAMLGKESEQAERARVKVNAERARIVASRHVSLPMTQIQSIGSSSIPPTKTSSYPCSSVV